VEEPGKFRDLLMSVRRCSHP